MIITCIKENFTEIISLLNKLDNKSYTFCHKELSNATIGEHTRHIIEMYQSLVNNYDLGIINYDKRERNYSIQTDIEYAINSITDLLLLLEKPNKNLTLQQNFNELNYSISTNYERELLYNLEHSIHHQALIKVAILKNTTILLNENFGVAKSTIEYRNQCVQ